MNLRRLGILTLALSLLPSCVDLSRTNPEKQYYRLHVERAGPKGSKISDTRVHVSRFAVSPGFGTKELVYHKGRQEYESDFYNEWFLPPAIMVTQEIREWLNDSGIFETVVTPSSLVEPNYILEGIVNSLYGDVEDRSQPKAILAMQTMLIRQTATNTSVVAQFDYRQEVAVEEYSQESLVAALNQALGKILKQLETDLQALRSELAVANP